VSIPDHRAAVGSEHEPGTIETAEEEQTMTPIPDRDALRDRFVAALLVTARMLQPGPDPEVTLEVLIDAAGVVQEKLRAELAELRVEQVE
jgi:hypothetical protein